MAAAILALAVMVIPVVSAMPNMTECTTLPSFKKNYKDPDTNSTMQHGQCKPSLTPGAYYTKYVPFDGKTDDKVWSCWSDDNPPADFRTDAKAKAVGFEGVCSFNAYESTVLPKEVPACSTFLDHNPIECSPGPTVYWGACLTEFSEKWMCIDKGDETAIEGYAKGDCSASAVREDTEGRFYDGVCRFSSKQSTPYQCDKISTYSAGNDQTCGQTVNPTAKTACFSLKAGVVWQCINENAPAAACDWTPSTSGFFEGECLFPGNPGYNKASKTSPTLAPTTTVTSTTVTTTTKTTTTVETTAAPVPVPPAPAPVPAPKGGGDDGGMSPVWIVLLIFLVVAAAAAFFFFGRRAAAPQRPGDAVEMGQ